MKRAWSVISWVAFVAGCGSQTAPAKDPGAPGQAQRRSATSNPVAANDDGRQGDPGSDEASGEWGIVERDDVSYARTIEKVASMTGDADLAGRVGRRGMSLVNVAWEDTGRAQGSALGPNITDLSLQVRRRAADGQFQTAVMPVVRLPNFTDRTGDVAADKFLVRVGNEKGTGELRSVLLTDVLKNLRGFAAAPSSIRGSGSLLAPRDSHFLVSAQAVFLPIPKSGKAEFNPVVFNYQSAPGSPAVLTILVTREGTSMQVVENRAEDRTAAGWGQEIYFDAKGQRAAFTAERKSDVESRIAAQGGPQNENDRSALAKGADVLFLVQVPLMHKNRGALGGPIPATGAAGGAPMKKAAPQAPAAAAPADLSSVQRSDVEQAVLGHGPSVGPFNEGHELSLVRDARFPIRVTVQFYKATSNGVVSDADLDGIARSIGGVYEHADFVGSLVIPEGDPRRPTAWQKVPHEWFPW